MATSDLGKVRPYFRGAYSASTPYEFFDCAKYNNTWWLCKNINGVTGVTPVEGDDWTKFALTEEAAQEIYEATAAKADEAAASATQAAASAASIKPNFYNFSIATTDWVEERNETLGTNFKATITSISCNASDVTHSYFDLTCIAVATNCSILSGITATNKITFYAVTKPTTTITGKIATIKTSL